MGSAEILARGEQIYGFLIRSRYLRLNVETRQTQNLLRKKVLEISLILSLK